MMLRNLHMFHPSVESLLPGLLAEGLDVEVRVTGTSMAPFIRDQDIVILGPLEQRALNLGEIVACQRPGNRWILHRIVALSRDSVLTRGDAATEDDGWISRKDLIARLKRIERHGRPVHLGLGRERVVLAWLSGRGLLARALRPLRLLLRRRDSR